MSVYRILDFLENEDLVHRLNLAKKYVACSHITCKHAHQVPQFLICKRCSKVKEIGIDAALVQSLKNHIDEAGYSLASQQLEFDCLCADCSVDVESEARA
jgi:Fur family zinc uptake transcriptional regulator